MYVIEGLVGKVKVEVMVVCIWVINLVCWVYVVVDFVICEIMVEYIVDFDYLIDCIDSVVVKVVLIVWCKWCKILVIIIGGVGG